MFSLSPSQISSGFELFCRDYLERSGNSEGQESELRKAWKNLGRPDRRLFNQRVRTFRRVWLQDLDPDTDPDEGQDDQEDSAPTAVLGPEEVQNAITTCPDCGVETRGLDGFTEHLRRIESKSCRNGKCPVCSRIQNKNMPVVDIS